MIEKRLVGAEERIAAARARQRGAMAMEAEQLSAAFASARVYGISTALKHGEALVMSGLGKTARSEQT